MKKCIIILVVFMTVQAWASLGGFAGNSADEDAQQDAWFLGHESIRWCIYKDVKISVSRDQAQMQIQQAFKIWQDYLAQKQVVIDSVGVNLRDQYLKDCDGSEDLKFYLGFINDDIQKNIDRLVDPIGMAVRTSYDTKKLWGKGYIWLKSDLPDANYWGWTNNILGGVLHELGHVLGCEHVGDTIMDVRTKDLILRRKGPSIMVPEFYYDAALSRIDVEKELYFAPAVGIGIYGLVKQPTDEEGIAPFKDLLGITPKHEVRIAFFQGQDEKNDNVLIVFTGPKDDSSFAPVKLIGKLTDTLENRPVSEARIFRRNLGLTQDDLKVPGYTRTGYLKLQNGEEILIQYSRNLADKSVVKVHYLWKGRFKLLMQAFPVDQ